MPLSAHFLQHSLVRRPYTDRRVCVIREQNKRWSILSTQKSDGPFGGKHHISDLFPEDEGCKKLCISYTPPAADANPAGMHLQQAEPIANLLSGQLKSWCNLCHVNPQRIRFQAVESVQKVVSTKQMSEMPAAVLSAEALDLNSEAALAWSITCLLIKWAKDLGEVTSLPEPEQIFFWIPWRPLLLLWACSTCSQQMGRGLDGWRLSMLIAV